MLVYMCKHLVDIANKLLMLILAEALSAKGKKRFPAPLEPEMEATFSRTCKHTSVAKGQLYHPIAVT